MDDIWILWLVFVTFNSCLCSPEESQYKLCYPPRLGFRFSNAGAKLEIKGSGGSCSGCDKLKNCTTFHGSIQIQGFGFLKSPADDPVLKNELYFPKLTEITGYLLISLLSVNVDLNEVFPNLAVIRGGSLFLDYSLVIYMNVGLRRINLPSLNVIMSGGIRIEKNLNLCYAKTIRWKSIMRVRADDSSSLVISENNNDCYDLCYKGKCFPPAGHGASGKQYCWAPGTPYDYSCQNLCDTKCGISGCVTGSSQVCCHPQCLGGCSKVNSQYHCHACKNFRLQSGECVSKCPAELFESNDFECIKRCRGGYLELEGKCVKDCPAGYIKKAEQSSFFLQSSDPGKCEKCVDKQCPRVCKLPGFKSNWILDSLSAVRKVKGCTVIEANLIIQIRGGGGSVSEELEENLGMLEKVKGYIMIQETNNLVSLKFLKNLKVIQPRITYSLTQKIYLPLLFNARYALTIMDNPKLEQLWDINPKLNITSGVALVRLNPRLCPSKIKPLIDILEKPNKTSDISMTTNGNDVPCQVTTINLTLSEIVKSGGHRCGIAVCPNACIQAKWNEVKIDADYRNLLFYTLFFREAPSTNITGLEDTDDCSSNPVWRKKDIAVRPRENTRMNVSDYNRQRSIGYCTGNLKPDTIYAMYVEAVTLNKKGARSKLTFIKTRETVPEAVVGLDASYLDDKSLLVKWQEPLYPNGKIIKFVVTYQESGYSAWNEDNFNWCDRQMVTRRSTDSVDSGDKDKEKPGTCNVTCVCDKDKEIIKPEKQAAIFAKEFQDALLKAFFNKKNDDANPTTRPRNITSTTFPITQIVANRTNCTADSKDPECLTVPTTPSSKPAYNATGVSSSAVPINMTTNPTNSTPITPTRTPRKMVKEVNGTKRQLHISGLRHFVDYRITVCACTSAGCTLFSKCSSTKGRTGRKENADDLDGPLKVKVQNATKTYNITWTAPKDPNSLVLKYDVEIRHISKENTDQICRQANAPTWIWMKGSPGNYSARVRAITPAGNGSWSNLVTFYISHEETDGNGGGKIPQKMDVGMIIGASLAACSVIILACGIAVWYITRKRYEEKQIHTVLYASVNPEYMNSSDVYIADEWEVPRDKIKLIRELGQGSFGMVYEGEAIDIVKDQPRCRVAVKTVSENASVKDRIEFLQEASIMKAFHCYHVVELLGVVSDGQPTLVIMELMHNGDLKNHLRSRRPGEGGELPPPTLDEMLQMAGEIADGMAYLASRKFVHRDLAARNCMVNENLTVKIGDFGMTRDIYETDYYRKGGKGLLPVRWMAPESLKDGVFTSPSDVWSYGVVLWEMVTLASQPYPGKSNEEVLKFVVDGGVMEKPPEAPQELYELMTLCWQFKPKTRPTFLTLINMIEDKLSEDFKKNSFYSTLPRAHLQEMLRLRSFYIPRQRAETIQNEEESKA